MEKEGDQMVSRYIRYDNIIEREVRCIMIRDINLVYYFIITFFNWPRVPGNSSWFTLILFKSCDV